MRCRAELEEHMHNEETKLFPLMRQQDGAPTQLPVTQMRHDHDRHGELLRHLETVASGFVLPEGACRSWQALYAGTGKLVNDVMQHIHLENNVLFPRFEHLERRLDRTIPLEQPRTPIAGGI
jgi:regulator of cell morphogenesis and NO signaling